LDYELYLPKGWTTDAERMRLAGVPSWTLFRKKWQIALDILDRVRSWDVPIGVVVGDIAYGKVIEFRRGLAQRSFFYLLEVGKKSFVFRPAMEQSVKRGRPRGKELPEIMSV